MKKGLGITAFVLLLISFPIPIVGNLLSVLALLLATVAALGGERTWAIVVAIVGGIKLFFMSPSWMLMMYSSSLVRGAGRYGDAVAAQQESTNTSYFYFTLLIVLAPIVIVVVKSLRSSGSTPPGSQSLE